MAGQSLAQGVIEMQTTDKNDVPVAQEQENKLKRPPDWDDYNQDELANENGQSIPEYEFKQCVSW